LAAVVGVFVFKFPFIQNNILSLSILLALYLFQTIFALIKYGRLTSFHTYLAKFATILQGFFLISLFLLPQPFYWLFDLAVFFTMLDLLEEILIMFYLPSWKANVKGIYWVLRKKGV
jgi:CDP-diacylglycerol--glycerol-3-phosphate 3-phosphatidyltransferase